MTGRKLDGMMRSGRETLLNVMADRAVISALEISGLDRFPRLHIVRQGGFFIQDIQRFWNKLVIGPARILNGAIMVHQVAPTCLTLAYCM